MPPSTQSYIFRSSRRSGVWARVIAIAALVGAVALRLALDPYLGDSAAFVTLFGAVGVVGVAVWMIGPGVTLAFALLGYLVCYYLFVEPRYPFSFGDARTAVGMVAYGRTALRDGFSSIARQHTPAAVVRHQHIVQAIRGLA